MFCVECGNEEPIFRDGVCRKCYLKTHTFTKGPKEVEIPICAHCSSYKYKNTWTSDLFGDVIRRVIKNFFEINRELRKVDIATECKELKENMSCKVFITGFLNDVEINEEHDLLVHLNKTVCDVCSKRFGGYHEAIVQIRAENRELKKEELEQIGIYIENLVEDLRAKGNRALFITDIGEEHGGLDFFLSEKGAGLVIAKAIKDQYGGVIKQSSKNIGMRDSKQLYRVTYLVRLPSFVKGDFLKIDNSFFLVNSVHGNKVKLLNLENWGETIKDIKIIHNLKIIGRKELIIEMILVSQTKEEIQVMDPKNYVLTIIKKPKIISFDSDKIKVIRINEQFFIHPI
jgi:nonsense-mediated mRNA decay protein 3